MTNGAILIGADERQREPKFHAVDPSTGQALPQAFSEAGDTDVTDACAEAEAAFPSFAALTLDLRAAFLDAAAERIGALGDELISTAMAETGLARARLEGEQGRTTGQLRLFAQAVQQGDWLEATIDPALPARTPPPRGGEGQPRPSRDRRADGPRGARGGGCVRVGGGVSSYLPGMSNALGAALVSDPRIKAVGFTGLRAGGLALVRLAQARDEPIPVHAEMSSINPVVLLPLALAARAEALGPAFVQSLTLGAGRPRPQKDAL